MTESPTGSPTVQCGECEDDENFLFNNEVGKDSTVWATEKKGDAERKNNLKVVDPVKL